MGCISVGMIVKTSNDDKSDGEKKKKAVLKPIVDSCIDLNEWNKNKSEGIRVGDLGWVPN